jgi:hypothetical protein
MPASPTLDAPRIGDLDDVRLSEDDGESTRLGKAVAADFLRRATDDQQEQLFDSALDEIVAEAFSLVWSREWPIGAPAFAILRRR